MIHWRGDLTLLPGQSSPEPLVTPFPHWIKDWLPWLSSATLLTTHPHVVMTVVMSTAKIYSEFLFTGNCIRKIKNALAKLELMRDASAAG